MRRASDALASAKDTTRAHAGSPIAVPLHRSPLYRFYISHGAYTLITAGGDRLVARRAVRSEAPPITRGFDISQVNSMLS